MATEGKRSESVGGGPPRRRGRSKRRSHRTAICSQDLIERIEIRRWPGWLAARSSYQTPDSTQLGLDPIIWRSCLLGREREREREGGREREILINHLSSSPDEVGFQSHAWFDVAIHVWCPPGCDGWMDSSVHQRRLVCKAQLHVFWTTPSVILPNFTAALRSTLPSFSTI